MTTTKSFSEKSKFFSIFRSTLKNQMPFLIVAAIVFSLLIPLVVFVSVESHTDMGISDPAEIVRYYSNQGYFSAGVYMEDAHGAFVLAVLVVFALVIAIIQNSYLHSKKMVDLYHSLPIRRSRLLGANMLASMVTVLGPFFAVILATVGINLVRFGFYIPNPAHYFAYIGLDLLCAVVAVAVVYIFTTFVAVNVGTVFDTFAMTGAIGLLPLVMYAICAGIWSVLTYGGSANFDNILLLSPFTFPFQRYLIMNDNPVPFVWPGEMARTAGLLLVGALAGVGLYAATVARYNRRKSEVAEQIQPGGILQTIAKCFGAFGGGALFFAIFYSRGMVAWIAAIFAGALLIGVIVELVLSRGVRSVVKNLKWLLAAGALCCLVVIGCRFDFTGYVRRVPEAGQVESVKISARGRFDTLSGDYFNYMVLPDNQPTLTSPESIAVVTELHRLAVENQPPMEYAHDYSDTDASDYPWTWLTIRYKLKNGSELTRQYRRMNTAALRQLADLEDKDDFIRQNHALFLMEGRDVEVQSVTLYNAIGGGASPHHLPEADMARLLEAARADMLAESLADIQQPKAAAHGYLEVQFRYGSDRLHGEKQLGTCTVIVGQSYTNTVAVLTDLGLMDAFELRENINQVAIAPIEFEYGGSLSMQAVTPNMGMRNAYEYSPDYYVKSEDAAVVKAALAAGRSQMLRGGSMQGEWGAVVISYFENGQFVGSQLARPADLPEAVRRDLERIAGTSEDSVIVPVPAVEVEFAVKTNT